MEVDIPSEYLYLCGRWTEKNFNQKKYFFFFIYLPISDELEALTFVISLFQFPKISNNAITNQPISDEFGTSLFLAFPPDPEINRNAFTAFEVKRRPPILPWRHIYRL